MASYREEEDLFEEDIVFDQAGLLTNTTKMNTAIRRVSSGKCALFAKTLGLCGAFFSLGLCIAIPGPTFLSPITELQANISPISSIYAARTSGYLIGSVIGGFLFDYFNRLFLLFISLLLTAVFITVTPWCHVLWLLQACMVFLGMTMGFLDTGGNVLCLDLWGRNSGPFMQALHFSFGLGAFVAPLLAAPFLEPRSIDVLPTAMASTAVSFQSSEMRGRREALPYENLTETLFDHNQIWLDSSTKSLDNVSMSSDNLSAFTEIPINSSTSKMMELSDNNGLKITAPTVKSISTIARTPKPKPQKIDPAYYHVKSPPKEVKTTTVSTIMNSLQSSPSSDLTDTEVTSEADTHYSTSNLALTISTSIKDDETTFKNGDISNVRTVYPSVRNLYSLHGDISSTSESFLGSSMLKMLRSNDSITITKETYTKLNPGAREMGQKSNENMFSIQNEKKNVDIKELNSSDKSNDTGSTSAYQSNNQSVENLEHIIKQASLMRENNNLYVNSSTGKSMGDRTLSDVKAKEGYKEQSTIASTYSTWTEREEISTTGNLFPKHIHHKPLTYDNDTEVINSFFNIIASRIEKYGFSKVQFTYLMVGLFVFAISLVFLGFLCHNPRDPKSKQEEGQGAKKISNKALHALLISLMAVFFLLYVGLEVTYGQLVLAFAVHGDLQLTRSTGLVVAIVFWGSFAAMRFASIFFSSGFGPITMLGLNFVFCTLGTLLLSSMASHMETALWVGTALLGIGLASIFPTGILWIERYIHVSNKVAAAFVIGASLGEMVCPVTVYHLMVNDPAMLMHSAVVINILCILTFIAIRWLALRHGEKYCAASNNGYQLANQDEEEDMIDMFPSDSVMALRRHSFSSEHRALLNGNPHRGP